MAMALACSGVCRPICPRAQTAAPRMWSSFSSFRHIASWTTPCETYRHPLIQTYRQLDNALRNIQAPPHSDISPAGQLPAKHTGTPSFRHIASWTTPWETVQTPPHSDISPAGQLPAKHTGTPSFRHIASWTTPCETIQAPPHSDISPAGQLPAKQYRHPLIQTYRQLDNALRNSTDTSSFRHIASWTTPWETVQAPPHSDISPAGQLPARQYRHPLIQTNRQLDNSL